MKRPLLFAACLMTGMSAFAQQTEKAAPGMDFTGNIGNQQTNTYAQKSTHLTDTLYFVGSTQYHEVVDSSIMSYYDSNFPIDSGYRFGHNYRGDKAFAEQYSFNYKTDTTINILGVRAIFTGRVNTATATSSSTTATITVWDRGTSSNAGTKLVLTGYPNTAKTTLAVPFKNLAVYTGSAFPSIDSIKDFYFPTQLKGVNYPFFVGYSLPSYTFAGLGTTHDTIAVRSSPGGHGINVATYTIASNGDTQEIVKNAVQTSAGTWVDAYRSLGLVRNLSMIPIIRLQSSVGVKGFTNNDLTYLGDYPNPANSASNIRFRLATAADVTLQVVDLSGRLMYNSKQHLNPGEQVMSLDVSKYPAGNYTYMLQTSGGGIVASQLTVTH